MRWDRDRHRRRQRARPDDRHRRERVRRRSAPASARPERPRDRLVPPGHRLPTCSLRADDSSYQLDATCRRRPGGDARGIFVTEIDEAPEPRCGSCSPRTPAPPDHGPRDAALDGAPHLLDSGRRSTVRRDAAPSYLRTIPKARSSPRPGPCRCASATTSRPTRTAGSSPSATSTSTATAGRRRGSSRPARANADVEPRHRRSSSAADRRRLRRHRRDAVRARKLRVRDGPDPGQQTRIFGNTDVDTFQLGDDDGLATRPSQTTSGQRLHQPRLEDAGLRQRRRPVVVSGMTLSSGNDGEDRFIVWYLQSMDVADRRPRRRRPHAHPRRPGGHRLLHDLHDRQSRGLDRIRNYVINMLDTGAPNDGVDEAAIYGIDNTSPTSTASDAARPRSRAERRPVPAACEQVHRHRERCGHQRRELRRAGHAVPTSCESPSEHADRPALRRRCCTATSPTTATTAPADTTTARTRTSSGSTTTPRLNGRLTRLRPRRQRRLLRRRHDRDRSRSTAAPATTRSRSARSSAPKRDEADRATRPAAGRLPDPRRDDARLAQPRHSRPAGRPGRHRQRRVHRLLEPGRAAPRGRRRQRPVHRPRLRARGGLRHRCRRGRRRARTATRRRHARGRPGHRLTPVDADADDVCIGAENLLRRRRLEPGDRPQGQQRRRRLQQGRRAHDRRQTSTTPAIRRVGGRRHPARRGRRRRRRSSASASRSGGRSTSAPAAARTRSSTTSTPRSRSTAAPASTSSSILGTEFADDIVITAKGIFGAGLNVRYADRRDRRGRRPRGRRRVLRPVHRVRRRLPRDRRPRLRHDQRHRRRRRGHRHPRARGRQRRGRPPGHVRRRRLRRAARSTGIDLNVATPEAGAIVIRETDGFTVGARERPARPVRHRPLGRQLLGRARGQLRDHRRRSTSRSRPRGRRRRRPTATDLNPRPARPTARATRSGCARARRRRRLRHARRVPVRYVLRNGALVPIDERANKALVLTFTSHAAQYVYVWAVDEVCENRRRRARRSSSIRAPRASASSSSSTR